MALIKLVGKIELLYDDKVTANPEDMELAEIAYEMQEGSVSGVIKWQADKRLSRKQMAAALIRQGSSPEFLLGDTDDDE